MLIVERSSLLSNQIAERSAVLKHLAEMADRYPKVLEGLLSLELLVQKNPYTRADMLEWNSFYLAELKKFVASIDRLATNQLISPEQDLWHELLEFVSHACDSQQLILLPSSSHQYVKSLQRLQVILHRASNDTVDLQHIEHNNLAYEGKTIVIERRVDTILRALEKINHYIETVLPDQKGSVALGQLSQSCGAEFESIDKSWSDLVSAVTLWRTDLEAQDASLLETYLEYITDINDVIASFWRVYTPEAQQTGLLSISAFHTHIGLKIQALVDKRNMDIQLKSIMQTLHLGNQVEPTVETADTAVPSAIKVNQQLIQLPLLEP
jgi:hypothetical protein